MTEHFHEHRVLTDHDPQGLAYGLIQTFLDEDDVTFKRLVAAAVGRGPERFDAAVAFLVDLVVPHQAVFAVVSADDGLTRVRNRVQGLILARGTGLADVYEQILRPVRDLDASDRAVHVAVLAQLAAGLVVRGHLSVPTVAFADLGTS